MGRKTRMFRCLGSAVALGVLTSLSALGATAGATEVTQESYKFSGGMAEGSWTSVEEPALGSPRAVAVMGADATSVHKVPGAKTERLRQPAVLAMGLMTANGPQEWRCIMDPNAFVIADDLSEATLWMDCLAEVYSVDPVTGEEAPIGDQIPLSVQGEWTAIGPIESQKSHSLVEVGASWTLDLSRSSGRSAVAFLMVISPDGVVFDGQLTDASLASGKGFTLTRE